MWTAGPARKWMSLLMLGILLLSSEVISNVARPCCSETSSKKIPENIKLCFKDGIQEGCTIDAYRLITDSGKVYCVKPTFPKLKEFLKNNPCPPITAKNRRLKLLRDVD